MIFSILRKNIKCDFKKILVQLCKDSYRYGRNTPTLLCIWIQSVAALVMRHNSEFMRKTFQAAQLTHERFLTIVHSCKIFFWYLPNWTSTDLWCVALYVTYSTAHRGRWKFSLADSKKYFARVNYGQKSLMC